jgi:hypothetical protein
MIRFGTPHGVLEGLGVFEGPGVKSVSVPVLAALKIETGALNGYIRRGRASLFCRYGTPA